MGQQRTTPCDSSGGPAPETRSRERAAGDPPCCWAPGGDVRLTEGDEDLSAPVLPAALLLRLPTEYPGTWTSHPQAAMARCTADRRWALLAPASRGLAAANRGSRKGFGSEEEGEEEEEEAVRRRRRRRR